MIYLHTGQPGAGKTLFTLDTVRKRAKKENRPVFYHGIELQKPELFEGWQLLEDPARWMDCPDGAIIVHDECQTLYRPRGNGAQVPEYVARFETHRHNGWDIYLITQHPMLVDSNVRRLTGEHVHVVRAFGAGMATLHKWGQVKEQCDKSRADSVSETRAYPRELFDAYKSATIHTHKARIPPRVFLLLAIPLLLGLLVWAFMGWYQKQAEGPDLDKIESMTGAPLRTDGMPGERRQQRKSMDEWLAEQQPRIAGLPHTAPMYDAVTTPVKAPYPAGCVAMATRCTCYTDQGTRMDTPDALCRRIAETGYFVAWDTSSKGQPNGQAAATPTAGGLAEPFASDSSRGGLIATGGTYGGVPSSGVR